PSPPGPLSPRGEGEKERPQPPAPRPERGKSERAGPGEKGLTPGPARGIVTVPGVRTMTVNGPPPILVCASQVNALAELRRLLALAAVRPGGAAGPGGRVPARQGDAPPAGRAHGRGPPHQQAPAAGLPADRPRAGAGPAHPVELPAADAAAGAGRPLRRPPP